MSREEKNLRRTQSFSSVPVAFNNHHNPISELGKPRGERIIRQTTTTINPGIIWPLFLKTVFAAINSILT